MEKRVRKVICAAVLLCVAAVPSALSAQTSENAAGGNGEAAALEEEKKDLVSSFKVERAETSARFLITASEPVTVRLEIGEEPGKSLFVAETESAQQQTEIEIDRLFHDTEYFVRALVTPEAGEGDPEELFFSFYTRDLLSNPNKVHASLEENGVRLSWNMPAEASGVRVLRLKAPGIPRTKTAGITIFEGSEESVIDRTIEPGAAYIYTLFSIDGERLSSGIARGISIPNVSGAQRRDNGAEESHAFLSHVASKESSSFAELGASSIDENLSFHTDEGIISLQGGVLETHASPEVAVAFKTEEFGEPVEAMAVVVGRGESASVIRLDNRREEARYYGAFEAPVRETPFTLVLITDRELVSIARGTLAPSPLARSIGKSFDVAAQAVREHNLIRIFSLASFILLFLFAAILLAFPFNAKNP